MFSLFKFYFSLKASCLNFSKKCFKVLATTQKHHKKEMCVQHLHLLHVMAPLHCPPKKWRLEEDKETAP